MEPDGAVTVAPQRARSTRPIAPAGGTAMLRAPNRRS